MIFLSLSLCLLYATSAYSGWMGTFSQNILLAVLLVTFVVATLVVEFAPPVLSFGLVALGALAWCS
jgi:hypothetical protein